MDIPSQLLKQHYTKVDIEAHILEYQLYGNLERRKRYMQYETDGLNQYQRNLYLETVNGLNIYKPAEIAKMKPSLKNNIIKRHNKAQYVLNIWKQEITNNLTNAIIDLICPVPTRNRGIRKHIIDPTRNFVDGNKKNKLSFKDLGIKKADIIKKLICENILPEDFYTLKSKTYGS